MNLILRGAKAYPAVVLTIVAGVVGLVMLATPARGIAPWIVGGYALCIAVWQAYEMVRQLMRGHAGLDILAVIAIVAAVSVGEPWAALVVVLMITGGEALEDYAENRSKQELTALLKRAPQQATRLLTAPAPAAPAAPAAAAEPPAAAAEERTETVAVNEISVGDHLLVRPGELVPVDAILLIDSAEFDESSLTGESLPVLRARDERIASGVVNGSTAITMRAAATSKDSKYQQIVDLVEQAQSSRAKTVRLADRYALPFTVVALVIAGVAWFVSGDPVRFAEVLVVATPCPLLIAAPVAFLGGMSRAAKSGLIVKGGGTLEQLAKVRSAAFDKTGTLTTGKPEPREVRPAAGVDEEYLLQLAASAEVYSSHVLASAVVETVKARGIALLPVQSAEESATNGVEAVVADGTVRVGKPSWVAKAAADLELTTLAAGELAIYVALDDRFLGTLIMRDELRPEAPQVLRELRELGLERFAMVTGDVPATANAMAAQAGIDEVYAECTPADKVRIASELQPRPLIMVGDGLNDAPVLAAADVGFAMGARGSTAASESADVVNRFDRFDGVGQAVRIGKDTVRIALESIWLGIAVSVGLMLVAAFGFLPAIVGAWMQEVVDLVAILWALRAIRGRRRPQP
ncbi:heavy metal-(Cd/Co/Hg/Pb/Zn)-translocating P-type ATPase [Leucobacter komagatae]|uniref:Heavy metal-(Cd/Co/Hg/Pb/Zn)-translocating P-type ATPase n=1 Tax=Leucobacter komagatae TaxID=55969 RepID=A0A542Y7G3_9MICO|nr:heavy metal translocating P-type ATPase [Leucobacter komagatae]TQL44042.1 heavy metal-(Cd/Co/Hg/Pb/Zn)-translocating P-type ATPase [Leucobacter komagatae]